MKFDIVRAWKDEAYRQTLSEELLNELPANPAGEMELSDACLDAVYGGEAGIAIPSGSIISILSNIRLFSVNVLANPFNQTCFQNR